MLLENLGKSCLVEIKDDLARSQGRGVGVDRISICSKEKTNRVFLLSQPSSQDTRSHHLAIPWTVQTSI